MAKTTVLESVKMVTGGRYRNRHGDYTVKSASSETVEVEYENGEKAVLNRKVQEHIVRNIETEKKLEAEIKWEQEHPREKPKNLAEYICSFCSRPGENSKCKMSIECKERNTKIGCSSPLSALGKRWWEEDKSDPKLIHMEAWTEKKVKTLQEMTMEELNAEIARLEAL